MKHFLVCFVFNCAVLSTFMHRLGHSHHSEGGVRHVGSHIRGQRAAGLPDL